MFFKRTEDSDLNTRYRRSTDINAIKLAAIDARVLAIERIVRALGRGLLLIGVGVSVSLITYFLTN